MCDISLQLKSLEDTLELLFERVLEACLNANLIKENEIEAVKENLEKQNLTPQGIVKNCILELKNSCLYDYTEVVPGSNRFQGKGNSSYKIEHHMKVFLKEKLKHFSNILSQTNLVSGYINEKKKKNKSFLQVLEDIKK